MNRNKLFLIVQSALVIVIALMLAAASVRIYTEGAALKAVEPLSWIYTREKAAAAIMPVIPLVVISLILTVTGLYLGIRDEEAGRPAKGSRVRPSEQKPVIPAGWYGRLRLALLVLAVLMIVAGVFNGSANDVFGKAIKICTECIGLG